MKINAVTVLGCTGSVGTQTLDAAEALGLRITALAAGKNIDIAEAQARRFRPDFIALADESAASALRARLAGTGISVGGGASAVLEAAAMPTGRVVGAIVGIAGLRPCLAALEAGNSLALANKESLVCAGALFTKRRDRLFPVDSEHCAIWQCLDSGRKADVSRLILTASGGPFRGYTRERLASVSPEDALRHPSWRMGPKITVDSATMMNKGFELIEASWLFDVPPERIDVLVHPQSVVHSMVEFSDGAVIAQLAEPDMRLPIAYALTYPERRGVGVKRLRLEERGELTFFAPDPIAFPAPSVARRAFALGGTACASLNAVNEAAVAGFLSGRIGFTDITGIAEEVLSRSEVLPVSSLEAVEQADAEARRLYGEIISRR